MELMPSFDLQGMQFNANWQHARNNRKASWPGIPFVRKRERER